VHHVAQQLARRIPNLHVERVLVLKVDAHHALVPLQERKRPIALQVEVEGEDYAFLQADQLLPRDLLPQQTGQAFNHHIEARVHVLVHLGCEQDADGGQLDQVGRLLVTGHQHSQISVCDTDSQVERVFGITLYPMQLLNERNHRLAVLRGDTQRIFGQIEVVSDGAFLLQHRQVSLLGVLGRRLSTVVVSHQVAQSLEVFQVERWNFAFQDAYPAVGHHLTEIQRANFLRLFESPVAWVRELDPGARLEEGCWVQAHAVVWLIGDHLRLKLRGGVR